MMSNDGLAEIPNGEEWFLGIKVPDHDFRYFPPLLPLYTRALEQRNNKTNTTGSAVVKTFAHFDICYL